MSITRRTTNRSNTRHAVTYRSGLESALARNLKSKGIPVQYEEYKLDYVIPESVHKYTPDFVLPNGIVIESKGIFSVEDRKKHLLIKEQYPNLDIRFVFTRSKTPLYKGASTTYADWCLKYGFRYADKLIPDSWLKEPNKAIPVNTMMYKWRKK